MQTKEQDILSCCRLCRLRVRCLWCYCVFSVICCLLILAPLMLKVSNSDIITLDAICDICKSVVVMTNEVLTPWTLLVFFVIVTWPFLIFLYLGLVQKKTMAFGDSWSSCHSIHSVRALSGKCLNVDA